MLAAKQDLLHRKAERAAIEGAFVELQKGFCAPDEVLLVWNKFALDDDPSKGQIREDLGIVVRDDGTVQYRGRPLSYLCLDPLIGNSGTHEPRMLTLAEVMTLKTIGPGHPRSSMSAADLLEDMIYNAWRDWCLNSLEGGCSSLRARAWTDVRNKFGKARAQRRPTGVINGSEQSMVVNPVVAPKKVYIAETSQWARQCDGLVNRLSTDIGKREAGSVSVRGKVL